MATRRTFHIPWILAWGLVLGWGAPRVGFAHTRERDRIAAFEELQEKRNALLAQGVKDVQDATARLEESIKARAQHADHLGSQIESLRSDVTAGLGRVVGSVTAAMAQPLQSLEERFHERLKERAEVEASLRSQAMGPLQARLDELAATQARDLSAVQADLDTQRASLKEFRTYLKTFSETLELRLGKLSSDVLALQKQHTEDQAQNARRSEALLKAVSEENLKLRQGLEQLAKGGGVSGTPGIHVVQKGESLYGIARQYGIDLEVLKKANPDLAGPEAMVHPGTKVKLPGR